MAVDQRRPQPQPDWIVSPGEILAEALEERSMTQAELSRRTARPLKTINEIVKGKAAITPETALQLEYALGISAGFWLNADREWQERRAREKAQHALKGSRSWSAKFPLRELSRIGLVPSTTSGLEQTDALLRLFGVTSAEAWERQWAVSTARFRRPSSLKSDPYALAAWLRATEVLAGRTQCRPFDAVKLTQLLPRLREMTTLDTLGFEDLLPQLLAEAGVVLVLLGEFGAARIYGASYWLSSGTAVIALSARGRKDDQFWFSLFHEIGHLLNSTRREPHLELEGMHGGPTDVDDVERQVNEFAAQTLVPDGVLTALLAAPSIDEDLLRSTADAAQVGVGILVGRLQHEGKLTWRQFPRLKRTVSFQGKRSRR